MIEKIEKKRKKEGERETIIFLEEKFVEFPLPLFVHYEQFVRVVLFFFFD